MLFFRRSRQGLPDRGTPLCSSLPVWPISQKTMVPCDEEKKEYVRQIFASINHQYDFLNSVLSLLSDRCWRWQTVRLLRDIPDGPVLDLCAGTLPLSGELARQTGKRQVFSLDFCENMLKTGVRKMQDDPCGSRIFPVCGDGEAIPTNGDVFYGCTVGFGVRNLVNVQKGLAEIYRVLRP
uniref:class I SAM-dependent methyltransferase n=1 Tax=Candidatus Electrothrix sp. TaxID=2170559 RepID=UPI004057936E